MADGGSKTAAMLTAVAALITAVVGALALILSNLPNDDGAKPPSSTPTTSQHTVEAWVSEVDAVCGEHAQGVSDTAAEVTTWGPIPDVIRKHTAAWHEYLSDIIAVRVPDPDEPVQGIRRDIMSARVSLVQYVQEYEATWPLISSGEMTTEEAAARQNPHWQAFEQTSVAALTELAVLGATRCGV